MADEENSLYPNRIAVCGTVCRYLYRPVDSYESAFYVRVTCIRDVLHGYKHFALGPFGSVIRWHAEEGNVGTDIQVSHGETNTH